MGHIVKVIVITGNLEMFSEIMFWIQMCQMGKIKVEKIQDIDTKTYRSKDIVSFVPPWIFQKSSIFFLSRKHHCVTRDIGCKVERPQILMGDLVYT